MTIGWKIAAALLLAALVLAVGGLGYGWNMAAHDRDVAVTELAKEREKSAQLKTAIDSQNEAIGRLGAAAEQAEQKRQLAEATAALNGKRFDAALARVPKNIKPNTCAEAMPYVNQILEGIK